jgi:chromosomal replication initiator protein
MINYIQKTIEEYFGLLPGSIGLDTNRREVVQPRQIAHYFAKLMTKLTLDQIGEKLGERDHATTLWSIKTVNNLIDTNKKYREDIEELDRRLRVPVITKDEIFRDIVNAMVKLLAKKLREINYNEA